MKKHITRFHWLIALALLTAACGGPSVEATPTADPGLVLTAAAHTAEAFRQATLAAVTPTSPSPTPEPSATPTVAASPTPTATATLGAPSATPATGVPDLRAEFIADVTIPDGTPFNPGQTFTKTWRLKNTGRLTWTTAFNLAFLNGQQMSAPALVPFTSDVPPGATVDLSVQMTAPASAGTYIGYWMLRDPNGTLFGIGDQGQWAFYVEIVVPATSGTAAATTTTGTPTVTATVTTTPAPLLSNLSLSVDAAEANSCPHVFNFTAQFTTSRSATVAYQLDLTADVSISMPPPVTASLQAGTHTALYQITFTSAASGNAVFHITSPENALSNTVAFKLTCP